MKIKTVKAIAFKRFHDLTIDLGDNPKKIIALVGPNGSGKSCIFDMFETRAAQTRGWKTRMSDSFYSKAKHVDDIDLPYQENSAITITFEPNNMPVTNTSFLIRTSYRYTSQLNITQLKQMASLTEDKFGPSSSIQLDKRLSENYERIYSQFIDAFNEGKKTGDQIKNELLDKINHILDQVLDIKVTSVGNVTKNNEGSFFFEKGKSKNFPYENLSSGEKEVIDIILDLIIRLSEHEYKETIFCIDEPELHLSTAIQSKLLIEIEKIIPDNCQLWIATHSIGFLRALQEDLAEKTQVINFTNNDFDKDITLQPMQLTRNNWKKIFETALEDLTGLVAPRTMIYCEGKKEASQQGDEPGLDAIVYNNIFELEFPDVLFVSSGGNTEIDKHSELTLAILSKALKDINILRLKDKDIHRDGQPTTNEDRKKWLAESEINRMLKRKEIENYIFDYEVIKKVYPRITEDDYKKIIVDCQEGEAKDNAGKLKELCAPGNKMNKEEFKIYLSQYITKDMNIYNQLKECIFYTKQI